MTTCESLVEKIRRYKTGEKAGNPRTDRLKQLENILLNYKLSDRDLFFIEKEIDSDWVLYQREREQLALSRD